MASKESAPLHVFVSPHFDDGAFSCGGTIHQLTGTGQAVTVMTMMGGLHDGDLPSTPIVADLHRRWKGGADPLRTRQREDEKAMRYLNARHRHISLADCAYRQVNGAPLYPTEESLFGDVHDEDFASGVLRGVSLANPARTLTAYLPLGVGHHVDHQIVRDWGLQSLLEKPDCWSIRFYAEYPYFNSNDAIALALSAIGLPLREQIVILDEANMQAKVKAIAHYESQISTFWNSLEAMEADVRRSSTHPETGHYVERYWTISS